MSNLQSYLDIIVLCQKEKDLMLKNSLSFCSETTDLIKRRLQAKDINPITEFNLVDINGLVESQTSHVIKRIFEYRLNGSYPIWRSFVETFISTEIATLIHKPYISNEAQRIDICVKEKDKYAVIFENKLKGATFQRNQLGRYIKKIISEGYKPENIFVVIIPDGIYPDYFKKIRRSAWCAPKDWYENNDNRKCCVYEDDPHACWCDRKDWTIGDDWCQGCTNFRDLFHEKNLKEHLLILDRNFADWLKSIVADGSIVPVREILLRSAIIQFADYIRGLYNIRLSKQEVMESIKVLMKELALNPSTPEDNLNKVTQTIEDINRLQQSLKTLQLLMRMRVWQSEVETFFPNALVDSDDISFGILINSIYCGIWYDESEDKLYWGFYHDPNKIMPVGAKDMVDQIVTETADIKSKKPNDYFLAWDWTQHGAERIVALLNTAERLGYKYQRKTLQER